MILRRSRSSTTPIQSWALAHIHDPLVKQGRIDQAVLPQNFGNVRPAGG
jgi:hypothetical protein